MAEGSESRKVAVMRPFTEKEGETFYEMVLVNENEVGEQDERVDGIEQKSTYVVSRSDFVRLLQGESLMYGPLRRMISIQDGPFDVVDDDSAPSKIMPPEPIEFRTEEPEKVLERIATEIEKDEPGLTERIRGVLNGFVDRVREVFRGGEGSGHYGHAGRPGEVGGSKPAGSRPRGQTKEYAAPIFEGAYEKTEREKEVDKIRRQYLFFIDDERKLPPLGSQEFNPNPMVWIRYYHPKTHYEWYPTEYDRESGMFFGWISGMEPGMGYFSRADIGEMLVGGQPVLRDRDFEPKRLGAVKAEVARKTREELELPPETPTLPELVTISIRSYFEHDDFRYPIFVIRGGPGSGHHGHEGRPGEVGGSLPSGAVAIDDMAREVALEKEAETIGGKRGGFLKTLQKLRRTLQAKMTTYENPTDPQLWFDLRQEDQNDTWHPEAQGILANFLGRAGEHFPGERLYRVETTEITETDRIALRDMRDDLSDIWVERETEFFMSEVNAIVLQYMGTTTDEEIRKFIGVSVEDYELLKELDRYAIYDAVYEEAIVQVIRERRESGGGGEEYFQTQNFRPYRNSHIRGSTPEEIADQMMSYMPRHFEDENERRPEGTPAYIPSATVRVDEWLTTYFRAQLPEPEEVDLIEHYGSLPTTSHTVPGDEALPPHEGPTFPDGSHFLLGMRGGEVVSVMQATERDAERAVGAYTVLEEDMRDWQDALGVDLNRDIAGKTYLYINYLGSKEPGQGYGTEMMMKALAIAGENGFGLSGRAIDSAAAFYEKLGAKWANPRGSLDGGIAFWTPDDVQKAYTLLKRIGVGEVLEIERALTVDGFDIFNLVDLIDPAGLMNERHKVSPEERERRMREAFDRFWEREVGDESEVIVVRGPLRRIFIEKGGEGSGHHGHEGRPGEVGGSLPSGEVSREPLSKPDKAAYATSTFAFQSNFENYEGNWLASSRNVSQEDRESRPFEYYSIHRPVTFEVPGDARVADRNIYTDQPIPFDTLRSKELAAVNPSAVGDVAKKWYEAEIGETGTYVFADNLALKGFVVHPSTLPEKGAWRASYFSKEGFLGHDYYDTVEEALAENLTGKSKGTYKPAPSLLERLVKLEGFNARSIDNLDAILRGIEGLESLGVERHLGPGDHPSGSEQQAHAGGAGGAPVPKKVTEGRKREQAREAGEEVEGDEVGGRYEAQLESDYEVYPVKTADGKRVYTGYEPQSQTFHYNDDLDTVGQIPQEQVREFLATLPSDTRKMTAEQRYDLFKVFLDMPAERLWELDEKVRDVPARLTGSETAAEANESLRIGGLRDVVNAATGYRSYMQNAAIYFEEGKTALAESLVRQGQGGIENDLYGIHKYDPDEKNRWYYGSPQKTSAEQSNRFGQYAVREPGEVFTEESLTARGGKGSGHRGHKGRKGEVGGSEPGEGGRGGTESADVDEKQEKGASKPESEQKQDQPDLQEIRVPESAETAEVKGVIIKVGEDSLVFDNHEQYETIKGLADNLNAEAVDREPELTSTMKEMSAKYGGDLSGLEFSVKSPESTIIKIRNKMLEDGLTEEEAAARINDMNRYTFLFTPDVYVEKVKALQKDLGEQGWSQYDTKYKNFWAGGDDYDGYNTVMENPETGQRVEIQYHTYESIQIKKRSHELYSQLRFIPESQGHLRKEVWGEMRTLWSQPYERPKNFELLEGVIMERRPE